MAFGIPDAQELENVFGPYLAKLTDHVIDRVKAELIPEIVAQLSEKLSQTTISFGEKPLAPKP